MIFGYCRVSTNHQKLGRQITNILKDYPAAKIYKEFFTGTTNDRKEWNKLLKVVESGDTIVFDSVSRMSRSSKEGFEDYKELYSKGVNLIFLNEPMINTSVFDSSKNNMLNIDVKSGNEAVDNYFKGNIKLINDLLMSLAEEQIKEAFNQSEKEVNDLHIRISEGMRESKNKGYQLGLKKGTKLITKKSVECKEMIKKYSKDFCGSLDDADVMKLCSISRNSYYKYKSEIKTAGN